MSTVSALCAVTGLLCAACLRTERAADQPPLPEQPQAVAEPTATAEPEEPPPSDSRAALRARWRQAIEARGGDPNSIPLNPSPPSEGPVPSAEPVDRDAVRQQWHRAIEERGD